MIKNLVFDIGGIIVDEALTGSKELDKAFYRNKNFRKCILGEMTSKEYGAELLKKYPEYEADITYMFSEEKQELILPVNQDVLNYLYELKGKYKIYFLSNLTDISFQYIKTKLKLVDDFDGGVFSCEEHLAKPQEEIFELLIKRYNLKKNETIFFDNLLRNVEVGEKCGIRSVLFKGIDDIKNNINE